jgi:Universal stress protein family
VSIISAALKPRSVLIATDFSETSEKALRYALAIACFYGSKFCLAHVVSSIGLAMAGPDAFATCEEAVRREVADVRDRLLRTGALAGIEHEFIVRQGELWPGLQEITRHEGTDLIDYESSDGVRAHPLQRYSACILSQFSLLVHTGDTLWVSCSSVPSQNRFSVRQIAQF